MKTIWICAALLAGIAWGQLSQSGPDAPQPVLCDRSQQLAVTNPGTVEMVAGAVGKSIYVCGFVMNSGGNTTMQLVQGQGASCATAKTVLTPAFKLTIGSTVTLGGSVGQVLKLVSGNALCLTTTSSPDVGVLVVYAQR
jgi:hypothetical protein